MNSTTLFDIEGKISIKPQSFGFNNTISSLSFTGYENFFSIPMDENNLKVMIQNKNDMIDNLLYQIKEKFKSKEEIETRYLDELNLLYSDYKKMKLAVIHLGYKDLYKLFKDQPEDELKKLFEKDYSGIYDQGYKEKSSDLTIIFFVGIALFFIYMYVM